MDIARPSNLKQKRIKRAAYAGVGLLAFSRMAQSMG